MFLIWSSIVSNSVSESTFAEKVDLLSSTTIMTGAGSTRGEDELCKQAGDERKRGVEERSGGRQDHRARTT
jgi:hypothetical protein